MSISTIGARYQIVIPTAERKRLGLRPHEKMEVSVVRDAVVMRPLRTRSVRGIGRELADGTDPVRYVRELREEWGRRE